MKNAVFWDVTFVYTRSTRRHVLKDGVLYCFRKLPLNQSFKFTRILCIFVCRVRLAISCRDRSLVLDCNKIFCYLI
jgi:hypothetical protein